MKIGKRMIGFLLTLLMALSLLPATALTSFASQTDRPSDFQGTVYVSYSHDGQFSTDKDGNYMGYVPVQLDVLADYDCSEYSEFDYDADGDGIMELTALKLFYYMLKEYGQGTDSLNITGSPGSVYVAQGMWNYADGSAWDENLNYYYNSMYPLESPGWGATCDKITLHDGDFLDVAHFSDWSFWNDPKGGFQYFAGDTFLTDYVNNTIKNATCDDGPPAYAVHAFEGEAGKPVKVTLIKTSASGDYSSTGYALYAEPEIFYGSHLYEDAAGSTELGVNAASDPSYAEITFNEPGTYWLWTQGQEGKNGTVVNSPAVARVTVTGESVNPNNAPTLAEGVPTTVEQTLTIGESYHQDLSEIFTDADNDPLTYKVKVNGSEAVAADSAYSYTPADLGTETLEFSANDGQADSTDTYTVNLTVERKEGTYYITHASGEGYSTEGAEGFESPVNEGESYVVKLNLAEGYTKGDGFAVKANENPLEEDNDGNYPILNITEDQTITVEGVEKLRPVIVAPAGSVITLGTGPGGSYYRYNFIDPVKAETLADGRVRNTYDIISDSSLFYRVQNPDGVTCWNYISSLTHGQEIEVTRADLHMDDDSFNPDTVYRFEYNHLDLADIYLNINERGYLPLNQGETYELNSFRNWFAIDNFTNGRVALPDMHYEVVDISGNPSDLVTIVPDEKNPDVAVLTASSSETGMAVVKITYDAMTFQQGMASGWGAGGADPTRFSAIWPESTGVFVVTVGADGSGIAVNMTLNEGKNTNKVSGHNIDAEHDPLFYAGTAGAQFSFTPEEGSVVSIARSTVGAGSLDFHGFTQDGVMTDEDGKVTLTGLTTGRHIVKVEKNGIANYQVLTARGVSCVLKDAGGNEVPDHTIFHPGDTFTAEFTGLTSPAEKLSGYYNQNFKIVYYGEDDETNMLSEASSYYFGQYDFSFNKHSITVTVPESWTGKTYTLKNGAIYAGGFAGGQFGDHRGCTYAKGKGMTHGSNPNAFLAMLPDITVRTGNTAPALKEGVEATEAASVPEMKAYSLDLADIFTDEDGDDLVYAVSVDGEEAVVADREYNYQTSGEGTVILEFTANDGYEDSETYTVTLTVSAATTATVDFTSQMDDAFLHAPQDDYAVASNLAETYGYTDAVNGVSVLDVLVAAHILTFGDSFTEETAESYLKMKNNNPAKQFGISNTEYYGGFFYNHAMANDGTMFDEHNWNGTLVGTQEVVDGDLVEFFFYQDEYYGDTYNWFVDSEGHYSRSFTADPGQDLFLTLKGFFAMEASKCKDEMELVNFSGASEVAAAQLYTVDLSTGSLAPVEGAITDEDGKVGLNFAVPGTYVITAYGTEDCTFKQILTLTTITVPDQANYSEVDAALAEASNIRRELYTEESLLLLDAAVEAVVPELPSSEQGTVDSMAEAIRAAIEALVLDKLPYDGNKVIFVKDDLESGFGMWSLQKGSWYLLAGDHVVIHIVPKNKTVYGWLHWGAITDELTKDVTINEDGTIDITTGSEYCGYAHPIAPIKKDGETSTSSQYYLAIPSADKLQRPGWITFDGLWYYTDNAGTLRKGWQQSGGKWYFMDPATGMMRTGWISSGGKWYYMDASGAMATGWRNVSGKWYYMDANGVMLTGWRNIGGKWYFMDLATGIMRTGLISSGGKSYYMDASGAMATGWRNIGGKWYYMDASGVVATGWQNIGNTWYFFKPSGAMAANEWYGGYWLNPDGSWTYQPRGSWRQNNRGWWFGDTSGWYARNQALKINDTYYAFDANGYMR